MQLFVDPKAPFATTFNSFVKALKNNDEEIQSFLKAFLIVSKIDLLASKGDLSESTYQGLFVNVEKASGDKCPRCWHWEPSEHEHKLCKRCQDVIKS